MEYFSLSPDKLKSPIGAAGDGVSIIGEKRDPFHRFGPCSGVLNSHKFSGVAQSRHPRFHEILPSYFSGYNPNYEMFYTHCSCIGDKIVFLTGVVHRESLEAESEF